MAASFKTRDNKTVKDGESVSLVLVKGSVETNDYSERTVTGVVRQFEHVERVYDGEGIAVGKTSEVRWEISTDDPQHPAIGFLPSNVLTKTG
jgi:hypothetical protein